jgi:hypothetical protein
MLIQTEIDFVSRPQNSIENQEILEEAKPRLNRQCLQVLEILKIRKLTVTDASAGIFFKGQRVVIGDLRARVRDLIDNGYPVQKETMKGGFKKYYL